MYSAFISIVLISIILAGWTCFAFISQPTKSGEIINVLQDMYDSQKSVIVDVVDLSKILINDSIEIVSDNTNISAEIELLPDTADTSKLDELLIIEDNRDNPLGIVIEPFLSEVDEESLPQLSEEPLLNEPREYSMNQIEMDIN